MVDRDISKTYYFNIMARKNADYWEQIEVALNIREVEGLLRDYGLYNFIKDDELPDEELAKRLNQYIDVDPDLNDDVYTIWYLKKQQKEGQ